MSYEKTSITELAVLVVEHLASHDIDVVLVGGLAVEIYSENLYLTKDIDMVNTNYSSARDLSLAMKEIGFRKSGRVFINDTTEITIEFPPGPLSVGDEIIKQTNTVKTAAGSLPILKIEDVIKDRLAAYLHWRDNQSLVQAVALMRKENIEPVKFEKFCKIEKDQNSYTRIEKFYIAAITKQANSMLELEALLAQMLIDEL